MLSRGCLCSIVLSFARPTIQQFDIRMPREDIESDMTTCKTAVHKWGTMNRVGFDASKKHIVIIHPLHGHGDHFKLLGCIVDEGFGDGVSHRFAINRNPI